jgi:hypothetical protein
VIRARVLPLLFLALCGCASYRLVRAGELNANAAERVKAKLVALRGLRFTNPVPIQLMSANDARGVLERELRHQYEPGELARLGRVYGALGLFDPGTDLEHAFLEFYGQQVAGFYEPIGHRMILIEDALAGDPLTRLVQGVTRRDLAGELILAHELTHALQDQHFGLDIGRTDVGEDDAQLARHAVYEGDATLAGFGVVLGKLSARSATRLAAKLERVPDQLARAYPDVPSAIRETVVFQYVAGVNFVSWAFQRGGWDGVNALLARPPVSTEQILHPEKYFVRSEHPLTVQIGALAPYLQAGWELAEEATLGELTIQLLMQRFTTRERAASVAAGWDGDRLQALARNGTLALVWLTAWDSEDDAREFFAAYGETLAAKHGGARPVVDGDLMSAAGGATPFHLERRTAKVLVIEGPLDTDLAEVAARVWRRSSYQPTAPWLPIDLAHSGSAATGPRAAHDAF